LRLPVFILLASTIAAPARADVEVVLRRQDEPGTRDRFEVTGLAPQLLQQATAANLFGVYVHASTSKTPLFGDYSVVGDKLVFEPRFALRPGMAYLAVFEPAGTKPVQRVFKIPRVRRPPSAQVSQVFPTRDVLPENQLKFYIHFSEPMSRGDVYRHIRLHKQSGEKIEYPFLELDQELWDASGKRFTLFFDPGRVKRGLRPREELGPALEEGVAYKLVIEKDWLDAHGSPMRSSFSKRFRVVAPDFDQPNPGRWILQRPAAGTRDALMVGLGESLDHAMLRRVVTVSTADGEQVVGSVEVDQHETRLSFRPRQPWAANDYVLVIDTLLEDLAGNSIAKPFEVDKFDKVQSQITTELHEVPFTIARSPSEGHGRTP
jgi:hypothetical protein